MAHRCVDEAVEVADVDAPEAVAPVADEVAGSEAGRGRLMRLLLRSDVQGVGKKGDLVDVADGYARNFLVPRGLAMKASKGAEAQAASMRRSRDVRDAADRAAAEEIAKVLVPAGDQRQCQGGRRRPALRFGHHGRCGRCGARRRRASSSIDGCCIATSRSSRSAPMRCKPSCTPTSSSRSPSRSPQSDQPSGLVALTFASGLNCHTLSACLWDDIARVRSGDRRGEPQVPPRGPHRGSTNERAPVRTLAPHGCDMPLRHAPTREVPAGVSPTGRRRHPHVVPREIPGKLPVNSPYDPQVRWGRVNVS